MRIKICWTLCLAAIVLTTASPLPAQQEGPAGLARQQERQNSDLFTASQATRAQLPALDSTNLTTAERFGYQNTQNPLFTGGGPTATIYGNAFPGFDPGLARVNNAANQQVMELVKKIKEAESDEVKLELKAEMQQILDEQYDLYLSHHEAPLKQLEERLKKLRDEFESRKQAKDDLVKLRLDTIWYDAIGLGWPDNQRAAGAFSNFRQPTSPFASSTQPKPPSALSPRASMPAPGLSPPGAPARLNSAR